MANLQTLNPKQQNNLERIKQLVKHINMADYISQYESYYTIAYHSIGNLTESTEEGLR